MLTYLLNKTMEDTDRVVIREPKKLKAEPWTLSVVQTV